MSPELAAFVCLVLIGFSIFWILHDSGRSRAERCNVCGYLKKGPLHDKKACTSRRKISQMSEEELKTRQIHRINEDVFGF